MLDKFKSEIFTECLLSVCGIFKHNGIYADVFLFVSKEGEVYRVSIDTELFYFGYVVWTSQKDFKRVFFVFEDKRLS